MTEGAIARARYASPPCMAGELAPDGFDPTAVSRVQARDVVRWRWAERARLRAERQALSVDARRDAGQALAVHVHDLLNTSFGGAQGKVISAYWPIKGEPDLRDLLTALHGIGASVALPIVETKGGPLVFRRWTPATRMIRGDWNIPVPPPQAEELTPDIALAPLIGWDSACYRLGYGGGYFDRTLAALAPRPFTIGVGLEAARLATIYPQPHDIPLDVIVTEAGIRAQKDAP